MTSVPMAAASGLPPKVEPWEPGRDDVHDLAVGRDRGDGVDAAAERLAHDVDVGDDVLVVAGERPAGARQAGLDLVGDHQHVALGAERAEVAQEALGRHDHAALALDRLEQDGHGGLVDGGGDRLDVAVLHAAEAGGERGVARGGDLVVGEAHDGRGAAVEVALHRDDGGLPGRDALDLVAPLAADLDGGLDGLGAGVHRQDHVLAGEAAQGLGEAAELVVEERAAGQRQLAELLARDRDETLVGVAEVERRVAREAVEVALAVDVDDPGAVALGEHHGQRVVVVCGVALGGLDVGCGALGDLGGGGARGDVGRGHEHMVPSSRSERRFRTRRQKSGALAPDFWVGGAEGTRTPDPLHAMQMRYQLRHSPNIVLPWSRKDNAENISRHLTGR